MDERQPRVEGEAVKERTAAVITAFKPGIELVDLVAAALRQCRHVVVVDNTPPDFAGVAQLPYPKELLTVLADGKNVGLAAAINLGVAEAGDVDFLFLLDQDSVVTEGLVARLASHLDKEHVRGIASPAPWDALAQRYLDPRASRRPMVTEMPVVITSGMLVRRAAFMQTAGMREDFFVDCVDQDFCLQVRDAGWSIVQDRGLLIPHTLGESRWHRLGPLKLRATHHPTWRLYWVARNGIILSKDYRAFDPSWALTNLAILAYWSVTIALFEAPRWRRLITLARGVHDGLRGARDASYLPPGAA
jgi:rhamnosyltransferase